MNESRRREYQDRISDEAADWFAALQDAHTDESLRRRFADWLSASPEHVREYLALTALFTDISELPSPQDIDDLVLLARADPGNVTALPAKAPVAVAQERSGIEGVSRRHTLRRRALIAAGLAAVTVAGLWAFRHDAATAVYTTGIGEQKSFALPDGSVVTLNAVSRLQVNYTEQSRDLRLLTGEALFNVASQPQRPFRVRTAQTLTQAVGTRFNVRNRSSDTVVTVIEGRVKVAGPAAAPDTNTPEWVFLAPGQGARLETSGLMQVHDADLSAVTAWRDRRLVFASTRLGDAVAEFNLYNEAALELADAGLADIRITGAFYANDPESFALFLREANLAVPHPGAVKMRLHAPAK